MRGLCVDAGNHPKIGAVPGVDVDAAAITNESTDYILAMEPTANRPDFHDYSGEAMQTLGLPDSPVIHLAIRTVAELLQPLDAGSLEDARSTCIDRFGVSSGTVLESLPIEWARHQFLLRIGVDSDGFDSEDSMRTTRTDWLGQAKVSLEARGADPGPDAKRMATRYGWHPKPRHDRTSPESWHDK